MLDRIKNEKFRSIEIIFVLIRFYVNIANYCNLPNFKLMYYLIKKIDKSSIQYVKTKFSLNLHTQNKRFSKQAKLHATKAIAFRLSFIVEFLQLSVSFNNTKANSVYEYLLGVKCL